MASLVDHALRWHPDRLVVDGRDGTEIPALIEALNNGVQGALITLDSNDPEYGLIRMRTLCGGDEGTASWLVGRGVDVIVQLAWKPGGLWSLSEIKEVDQDEDGGLLLRDVSL